MLGPHTVTRVRPAGRDRWGDRAAGEEAVPYDGCFWQPVSTAEQQAGADTVTFDAFLTMPAAADVEATDRIRFQGREYSIEGRPQLHHTPAGPHHYELTLREVKG